MLLWEEPALNLCSALWVHILLACFTHSFSLKIPLTKLLFLTCLSVHVIWTAIFPVTQVGNFRLLTPPSHFTQLLSSSLTFYKTSNSLTFILATSFRQAFIPMYLILLSGILGLQFLPYQPSLPKMLLCTQWLTYCYRQQTILLGGLFYALHNPSPLSQVVGCRNTYSLFLIPHGGTLSRLPLLVSLYPFTFSSLGGKQ